LGANFKDFQELAAKSPASQLLQQIAGSILQHNLQADLLVVGMDDSGAHVFAITHPGTLIPLETTGFGAVGSGGVHAGVRMSLAQHTKDASLVETVYNVYESKRAAEVAPGVGKMTDLAIIKDGRICFAGQDVLKELENAHKEKPALSAEERATLEKVCDGFTKRPSDAK